MILFLNLVFSSPSLGPSSMNFSFKKSSKKKLNVDNILRIQSGIFDLF